MQVHELKIWPKYFEAVNNGTKTYEYRKNDREFAFGDMVILHEWNPDKQVFFENNEMKYGEEKGYTGRNLTFRIGYILPVNNGDDVVFSIIDVSRNDKLDNLIKLASRLIEGNCSKYVVTEWKESVKSVGL